MMNDMREENHEILNEDKIKLEAYWSGVYSNFFNARMEKDKAIFYIASGALGILMTSFHSTDTKIPHCSIGFWLFIGTALCFIIDIIMFVIIMEKNSNFLVSITDNKKDDEIIINTQLSFCQKIFDYCFFLGIILLFFYCINQSIS